MGKYLNPDLTFVNRIEAGKQLSEKIFLLKLSNPIIVALPRGGVEVAKPIADKLNAGLDIIASKKIGAPNNPELALGAVTSHGDYVISSYSGYELGEKKWDYLQNQIIYLVNDCREREKKYFEELARKHISYTNQNIILVDDGTATGMTALAAIKSIKKQNPKFILLAIPVISSQAYDEISPQINRIETLKIPREFIAVGVHYINFDAVSDEKIIKILKSGLNQNF